MSSQASLLTPSIRRFIGSWAASLESWDTASVSYGLRHASRMKQEGGLTRRDSLAARLTVIGMRDRREVSSEHPVTPVCASAHKRRHATRAPRHVVSSRRAACWDDQACSGVSSLPMFVHAWSRTDVSCSLTTHWQIFVRTTIQVLVEHCGRDLEDAEKLGGVWRTPFSARLSHASRQAGLVRIELYLLDHR